MAETCEASAALSGSRLCRESSYASRTNFAERGTEPKRCSCAKKRLGRSSASAGVRMNGSQKKRSSQRSSGVMIQAATALVSSANSVRIVRRTPIARVASAAKPVNGGMFTQLAPRRCDATRQRAVHKQRIYVDR